MVNYNQSLIKEFSLKHRSIKADLIDLEGFMKVARKVMNFHTHYQKYWITKWKKECGLNQNM